MKNSFVSMALLVAFTVMAEVPKPIVALPLNEGNLNSISESISGKKVKVCNPELLTWIKGADGQALQFNNPRETSKRAMLAVPIPTGFDLSKGFTLAVNIKTAPDIEPNKSRCYMIASFTDHFRKGPGFNVNLCWRMFYFQAGDGVKKLQKVTNYTTLKIAPETWYALVFTYDGNVARIYVDGNLQAEAKDWAITNPVHNKHINIGADFASGTAYGFEGGIANFRLYDSALSKDKIAMMK